MSATESIASDSRPDTARMSRKSKSTGHCSWANRPPRCWPSAATFTPTDPLDSTNLNTLRGAILAANLLGGTNTILLTGGAYPLTISGAEEDAALTGDLDITAGKLTILGVFATNVTVDATGLGDRVFHVLPGAQLVLSNLLVTGGKGPDGVASGDAGGPGGGIYNGGTLTLIRCVVAANAAMGTMASRTRRLSACHTASKPLLSAYWAYLMPSDNE